jgi:hypothetical protein
MDERLKFIARLLDGEKMVVLCRQFGIRGSCTRLLGVRRTICCHSLRRTIAVGPIAHDP